MDMNLERKVFDSFISTLKMMEHGPDEQDCIVSLTLGELRQHTKWCQTAARLCDQAAANNADYSRMKRKVDQVDGVVKAVEVQFERVEKLVSRANNLNSQMEEFKKDVAAVNRQQLLIRSGIKDAKTNS